MFWLLLAVQLVLSIVMLLAVVGKALRSEEFTTALAVSHLPTALVRPLSIVIPVLEVCLAIALLVSNARSLPIALSATALLLLAFAGWMAWVRVHGLKVECGCFGVGGVQIGGRGIARSLLLMIVAACGVYLAVRTPRALPEPSLWLAITVTSLCLSFALLLGLRAGFPSLVLTLSQLEQDQPLPTGAYGEG